MVTATTPADAAAARSKQNGTPPNRARVAPRVLAPWLRAQSVNVTRHAAALRPFRRSEFGATSAAPSEAHIRAANQLVTSLRRQLLSRARRVGEFATAANAAPVSSRLQQTVAAKERAHRTVRAVEKVWDFYFELFGQRQSQFADWLLSCDRIALDCYQVAYMGLGQAKSIPAPPPFSYMRTGFSPATFRRGIPLLRLGKQFNPFPLIQLPYHRLVNPWTLGAVLHEVSHNLHNELGLAQVVPRSIYRRLLAADCGRLVAAVWTRWNREIFADLSGLLLGGPAIVGSLMDVVGLSPASTLAYNRRGPHPTPYLRTLISTELLRRMGFTDEAEQYRRTWTRIYPDPRAGSIPRALLDTFARAKSIVVDAVCFQAYAELGNKSLAEVIRFERKEQQLVEEAARRLAAGNDPGVIPERFLIGAARFALDHRLAPPQSITTSFYRELSRR
jgi:hypothetical protein